MYVKNINILFFVNVTLVGCELETRELLTFGLLEVNANANAEVDFVYYLQVIAVCVDL